MFKISVLTKNPKKYSAIKNIYIPPTHLFMLIIMYIHFYSPKQRGGFSSVSRNDGAAEKSWENFEILCNLGPCPTNFHYTINLVKF